MSDATLTGGKLALDDVHLDGIELALALDEGGDHLAVKLDKAHARWVEKDLVIDAKGKVEKDADALKVDDFEVRAGGSRLAIAKGTGHTDGSQVQAEVAMEVKRADVLRFVSDLPLRADFTAAGTVSRAGRAEPSRPA